MPALTTIRFSTDDYRYEVKIDFDDKAIMKDQLSFDVTATVTNNEGKTHSEKLSVELDYNKNTGTIVSKGIELYSFSLYDISAGIDSETGDERIPGMDGSRPINDQVFDNINAGIGEAVAEMINAIPVPDPFLGCLLKAGISSVIGQAITCNELREQYGEGRRINQVFRCMKKHVKGIGLRTLRRALVCMAKLGF